MMKTLSLFSGIGAFEAALDNIGIDFELVGYCEIDKYASKSYSAIHGVPESMNFGDITKIDEKKLPKDIDLITYGFPCQDISLAGKQKGILSGDIVQLLHDMDFVDSEIADLAKWIGKCEHTNDEIRNHLFNEYGLSGCECDVLIKNGINESTRSGLFFQALRIIEETKPKIAIAENVKNLVSKKFSEQFKIVLDSLEQAGYNNYWKVLNAKDYGIPQNRERVFIVSIRKDVDTGVFEFPEPYELKLRLKDLLEDEVDEKFYISNKMTEYLINTKFNQDSDTIQNGDVCKCLRAGGTTPCVEDITEPTGCQVKNKGQEFVKTTDVANALMARDYKGLPNYASTAVIEPEIRQVGNIHPTKTRENPNQGRVYDPNYIAPALNTCGGGNLEPHVVVKTNNSKGYDIAEPGDYINIERPGSTTRRGRVGHGVSQTLDTKENHCVVTSAAMRGRYNEDGQVEQNIEVSDREIANAITTVQKDSMVNSNLRIRKLTPKECFRLMGFDDADFERAAEVNSNTQLYKQAGNSIVVDVLEELFCMMFDEDGNFFI